MYIWIILLEQKPGDWVNLRSYKTRADARAYIKQLTRPEDPDYVSQNYRTEKIPLYEGYTP